MKKKAGCMIILHMCTKYYDQMMYGSQDMVRDRQTDRQTDIRTEKVTHRGGCPPKNKTKEKYQNDKSMQG